MQQHPIPQNVTQYQFRLVGDMTLKQFLELCLGLVLAYLFFASNLIFIIKWPLIILSILFGAGLAFFPIEDRPLDQWIINFLKAIYAPTRFIWQKTNKIPHLFLFEAHAPDMVTTITKTIKAPTLNKPTTTISDLSEAETNIVKSLDSLFATLPPPTPIIHHPSPIITSVVKPSIAVRKLKPASVIEAVVLHTPLPKPISIPQPTQPSVSPPPGEPTIQHESLTSVVFTAPTAPTHNSQLPTTPPTTPRNITLPASPRFPNLITGVVVDQDNKLVENAIVQIVESGGIPARAMKTNSLGQFYTSTPLSPGTYLIEVDKNNLSFAPQQITINNTIMSPIELRASS